MELIKQQLVEFKFKDMSFIIRTKACVGDKLAVDRLLVSALSSGSIDKLPRIGLELIKQFVCGWSGVTSDGKPVDYKFDLIESSFPAALFDELIPELAKFIKSSVDILSSKQ